MDNHQISVFQEQQIRRVELDGEWFFNLVDIIAVLTESPEPNKYWSKTKQKMTQSEGFDELSPNWRKLKFEASNGKKYDMDAANRRGVLRILMSIPSPTEIGRAHV